MNNPAQNFPAAKVTRRLIAIMYDSLLMLAVLFLAAALPLFLTGGVAMKSNPVLTIYLFCVCYLFFGWFWTHGGQTLGMRAWRLKLLSKDGTAINWGQAAWRMLTGAPAWIVFLIGLGILWYPADKPLHGFITFMEALPRSSWWVIGLVWLVIDNWPNSWRDKLSGTKVVQLPKGYVDPV